MGFETLSITRVQAEAIQRTEEGQFSDLKARAIAPAKLTKAIAAFGNSDGGDLYIGISDDNDSPPRAWNGFADIEAANGHIQVFEELFPLGMGFQYEFLSCDDLPGLVLHIQIDKNPKILRASNGTAFIRRGAQSLPVDSDEGIRRLEYAKGLTSFEDERVNAPVEVITDSTVVEAFIQHVVPTVDPAKWLMKQQLIRDERPTVAGTLLFSDEPQAQLPKRCGIKIYRYETSKSEGFRQVLTFTPETIEGCIYAQIKQAVVRTTHHIESIQKLGEKGLESIKYPPETLHEIITNAVLHRDYHIADDVHIRIFDNRIEILSPGRLPAHITVSNVLNERFARNGAIVRILNKFPDPPNKDVGEGLNTAFAAMQQLGLKEPKIEERENSVLVTIRHEKLASPEEAIMEYLEQHETIKNKQARQLTHIGADYTIKNIFGRMVDRKMIEQVPRTRTSNTAYRKIRSE